MKNLEFEMNKINIDHTNPLVLEISKEKTKRARKWLAENQFDALFLSHRDNFAWMTTGGNGVLIESGSNCVACLAITADDLYICGHPMDLGRLLEEQIPEQGYQVIEGKWHEGSPQSFALKKLKGRIASDVAIPGSNCEVVDIHHLHYPLFDLELERLRWLGATINQIFIKMAEKLRRGMTENEIAFILREEQEKLRIKPAVTIVGSDERAVNHRHPLPTDKKIEKFVMLHTGPRRWGLHAPITRNYHFGLIPQDMAEAHNIVATIQAKTFSMTKPGMPYKEILSAEKDLYRDFGIPEQWETHYQGGPTGYRIVNPVLGLTDAVIRTGTAFEWFSTIPGMKIAELTILTQSGLETPSLDVDNKWPVQKIFLPDGSAYDLPGIMQL